MKNEIVKIDAATNPLYLSLLVERLCMLDEEDFNKNCEFIESELKIFNDLYDIYKSYEGINNIRTINKNAGGRPAGRP